MIASSFDVSGTVFLVHLYQGPQEINTGDQTDTVAPGTSSPITIQDVLLLENRDRIYAKNIIDIKGNYRLNDLDFIMTQFGIMQSGGVLFVNFHINQMIEKLGRRLIAGDVLEIVHRRDEVVLNPNIPFIPAYYVITDTAKLAEGYSATWWPHILRCKLEPISDSQEYKQIFDSVVKNGLTVGDLTSTAAATQANSDTIQSEANSQFSRKNFNGDAIYTNPNNPAGGLIDYPFDNDGTPPNMNTPAPTGTRFPSNPVPGDYFIRLDYTPPRMFQRNEANTQWTAVQEVWSERSWSPAPRALEDQMVNQPLITFGLNPLDQRSPRQDVNDPIPPKQDLPINPLDIDLNSPEDPSTPD